MTGPEHYRVAELLLASCQLGSPDGDGTEYYSPGDDPPGSGGINTLANALAAAQVHATLALAAATARETPARWAEVLV